MLVVKMVVIGGKWGDGSGWWLRRVGVEMMGGGGGEC